MMSARQLLVLAVLVCGCSRARSESTAATTGSATATSSLCPPDAFIEELHAAAFHFQHGPVSVARDHLERARTTAPKPADVMSAKILGQLAAISERYEAGSNWAQGETENVRVELGEWSCLPESIHQGFHAKLPPLP